MPEYLAPGVYVEETSFRAKSVEGVGTSTTAFVGPARRGPVGVASELLTSLTDFERVYGSFENLAFSDVTDARHQLNFLAHAVHAYFDNGGSRLYVVRTAAAGGGVATAAIGAGAGDEAISAFARSAGATGNGRLVFRETTRPATARTLATAPVGSLVRVTTGTEAAPVFTLFTKTTPAAWADSAAAALTIDDSIRAQLVTLSVEFTDADGYGQVFDDIGLGAAHPRFIGTVLAQTPGNRADDLQNLVWVQVGSGVSAFELQAAIAALAAVPGDTEGRRQVFLAGGTDGSAPGVGNETTVGSYAHALAQLIGLEDVSIVAAPGSSIYADAQAIQNALISHAEHRRAYRIAVLDTPRAQTPGQVRDQRGRVDSTRAALYYPWVITANPLARPGRDDIPREIALPPSGFITGIYARNDIERGVYKAPANEVVRGALRFETDINFAQQEALNPLGINCLRYLSGRGYRVWGARLVSSDPEWKYVSDRRYFNYLEASIDRGTQWSVFELNGERLWANVRQTISDFLYNEWRGGALLGSTVEEAFFVRCDRGTMTQNDLDNGRLICLIGVAIIKPAEFVIFRIGQKTADARA
ncbi:phage tail sheath family protein [Variovorax rhizosphaerae]|uniref:Phage tail sheath subtilisin-like domain-containing protein n=1 Tax=Variovorax rhizosphaerae TaxID=1836200 RepID=A0ABU8WU92_9BURK